MSSKTFGDRLYLVSLSFTRFAQRNHRNGLPRDTKKNRFEPSFALGLVRPRVKSKTVSITPEDNNHYVAERRFKLKKHPNGCQVLVEGNSLGNIAKVTRTDPKFLSKRGHV